MIKFIITSKLVMLLLLGWIPAGECRAQQSANHELQIGFGPWAREQVLDDMLSNSFRSLFRLPIHSFDFSESYTLTYRYQTPKRLALGLTAGLTKGSTFRDELFSSNTSYGHTNALMAIEAKFAYREVRLWSFYGVAGLGGYMVKVSNPQNPKGKDIYVFPTNQITPLGVRYGKGLGGFVEIGYGYKGILNFGVSSKF
ncbi:hypothetical protein [Dyadobacter tibetensis]|uniref:hypothetical protein n=1 Tax=Dyadobacter tibetensis TaxID=1211851 RepID=UPI0004711BAD|nr:hypothetical protein [Dyadobacter tibetensis]